MNMMIFEEGEMLQNYVISKFRISKFKMSKLNLFIVNITVRSGAKIRSGVRPRLS